MRNFQVHSLHVRAETSPPRGVMYSSELVDGSFKETIAADENYKYFWLNLKFFKNENNEYYAVQSED